MAEKIIVVGGGIAGLSAAEAARKENAEAEITLYGAEKDRTYYRLRVAEVLAKPEQAEALFLHDEGWYAEQKIKLVLNAELTKLDPQKKEVCFSNGDQVRYDKLIITTGSRSRQPDLPGSSRPNVFTLWTLEDARKISQAIADYDLKHIVIVGGGVLGMEAAWQLHQRGLKVSMLERSDHLMKRQLSYTGSEILQGYIESLGLTVYTDADTAEIVGPDQDGPVSGLKLKDGREIKCDGVLFSIGVLSNVSVAEEAGLEIDRRIKVNTAMETSEKDIYAAGDSCEVDDGYWFGLWSISMQQGKVAGTNAAGGQKEFTKSVPPYVVNTMKTRIVSQGSFPEEDDEGVSVIEETEEDAFNYSCRFYQDDQLVGFMLIGDAAKKMTELQKELA